MDKRLPDLPTVPMPAAKPPRKRRKRGFILPLALGGLLLLCLGIGIASALFRLSSTHTGRAQQADGTQILYQGAPAANGSPAAAQATQTASASASTSTPVPGATPQIGPASATHGRPHLGGPLSDFVGKYGPPTDQGDTTSQNFWVGTDQTIDLNVLTNGQGEVTRLDVLGPPSWTTQQAASYCLQFLPDQAVQFEATATQREYHSSVGVVVLTWQPQSCLLSFARS